MATTIEQALSQVQKTVPECVAVGIVDLTTGMLLGVKTVGSHPKEILDSVAAATSDIFQGPNVSAIEKMFRESRGAKDDGHHYFQEIIINSDNLLHVFQRLHRNEEVVLVCVCRGTVNLGLALSKARSVIDVVEGAV